jgi:SPP1 family predicted phage head-tail adaptor
MLGNSVINPSISAGELIHRVLIQAPRTSDAGNTGMSITPDTWDTVRTTYAAIVTAVGSETSQSMQLVSEVSHIVKVRYTPTRIAANYRVVFGTRIFIVKYVENLRERNRVLLLSCLEVNK